MNPRELCRSCRAGRGPQAAAPLEASGLPAPPVVSFPWPPALSPSDRLTRRQMPSEPLPQSQYCARFVARWLGLLSLVVACSGCRAHHQPQLTAPPVAMVPVAVQSPVLLTTDPRAAQTALEEAQRLDRRNDPAAVDYFFQAAALAAQGITPTGPANQSESIYRQALWGLVDSGQRLGRLDPRTGLSVVHGGQRTVPIRYFGFAWRPSDFSQLSIESFWLSVGVATSVAWR